MSELWEAKKSKGVWWKHPWKQIRTALAKSWYQARSEACAPVPGVQWSTSCGGDCLLTQDSPTTVSQKLQGLCA